MSRRLLPLAAAALVAAFLLPAAAFAQSVSNPGSAVTIPPYPQVANTATLRASCTSSVGCPTGDSVYSIGVWRNTDGVAGAPPLFYTLDTGSICFADDGGKCVAAANGGYWLGQFGASGADVRQWSVVMDGITDDKTTLQAALNWLGVTGSKLVFPAGTVYSSGNVSLTLPTNGSVTIQGAGADITKWKGSSGTAGFLTINETALSQSFHIRDLSCLAGGAASGTCITLSASGTLINPALAAQSDISNVTFRGADGYDATDYWTNAVSDNYISNVNFINDMFVGSAQSGVGIYLNSVNPNYGVEYNIGSSIFYELNYGIYYGYFEQGVTVQQSNFDGNNVGIYVPSLPNITQDELGVVNNQFGYNNYAIEDLNGVLQAVYADNTITDAYANTVGIYLAVCNDCAVKGNPFYAATNSGTVGVKIVTGTGIVTGNIFQGLGTGVDLTGSAAQVSLRSNIYQGTLTPIVSASPTNDIAGSHYSVVGQPYVYFDTTASASANDGGGHMELTVGSTAHFVSGDVVAVSNFSDTTDLPGVYVTSIKVVDATHLVLNQVGYFPVTSATVTAMP